MILVSQNIKIFSLEITLEDALIVPTSNYTLNCQISGLSDDTSIVWIGPDNIEISAEDTTEYVIEPGFYLFGSTYSLLTIKVGKLEALPTSSTYKCQVKSSVYPAYSPAVVEEMSLTKLSFGKLHFILLVLGT